MKITVSNSPYHGKQVFFGAPLHFSIQRFCWRRTILGFLQMASGLVVFLTFAKIRPTWDFACVIWIMKSECKDEEDN